MTQATIITRSVRILCAGGLALGTQAAYGQETAEPMQKVLITGSRIASPAAESPSPLQILSSADIAASGASNLQDLLQKNPTMGTPTVSRTNSNFLTSSGGVSTINLRNLGDSRTLVLVNGRRFVSGMPGESAVDLNTIPTDFIERVELLTGGASATYGSDAVAGVVNIILKKNFNGVLVDAQTGKSNERDDFKKKLALTFGTTSADGASNVMGHFGYSKQGAVYSRDRDFSAVDQTSAITQGHPELAFVAKKPNYSGYAPQGHLTTAITQKLAGGSVSGELPVGLAAGRIGIAAGLEWRDEDSSAIPDPLTQSGLNAGNALPPTFGSFTVREAFVETRVPLLKDRPFARELSFLGTVRHGDYSTVGSTNSWNAGLEWGITPDFKLRGTRAQSTRAPNINELYQAPSQDFPTGLVDPCEGVSSSGTSALAVNCRNAPGVAANMAAHGGTWRHFHVESGRPAGHQRL
jgi:outer membrane receptor protein involved in Fe transport